MNAMNYRRPNIPSPDMQCLPANILLSQNTRAKALGQTLLPSYTRGGRYDTYS